MRIIPSTRGRLYLDFYRDFFNRRVTILFQFLEENGIRSCIPRVTLPGGQHWSFLSRDRGYSTGDRLFSMLSFLFVSLSLSRTGIRALILVGVINERAMLIKRSIYHGTR